MQFVELAVELVRGACRTSDGLDGYQGELAHGARDYAARRTEHRFARSRARSPARAGADDLAENRVVPMRAGRIPYDAATRKALAKSFIENVILAQYHQLTGWQNVTQQTAQLDSGYLGQHLVSLISGTPGRGAGSRGKGHDLVDESEIKTASALGGIDAPRWNHASFGSPSNVGKYLQSTYVYFVLFDTATRYEEFPLRLRVWRVVPRTDTVFASVVKTWAKRKSSGNFQLHPPCWQEGSRVTNECGNLELPMIFEAVQREIEGVDFMDIVTWNPNTKKKSILVD